LTVLHGTRHHEHRLSSGKTMWMKCDKWRKVCVEWMMTPNARRVLEHKNLGCGLGLDEEADIGRGDSSEEQMPGTSLPKFNNLEVSVNEATRLVIPSCRRSRKSSPAVKPSSHSFSSIVRCRLQRPYQLPNRQDLYVRMARQTNHWRPVLFYHLLCLL